MEFTIRILVVIILIVIAFVVFVALIGTWGGESSSLLKGLMDWLKQVLGGKASLPTGSSTGLPGTVKP